MARREARGFALALVLIALLIVGALAMVVVTRYSLGPILSGEAQPATPGGAGIAAARSAEAKLIAGALWAAVQSSAASACGTPVSVQGKLQQGRTQRLRSIFFAVVGALGRGHARRRLHDGRLQTEPPVLFTVAGMPPDVMGARVQLQVEPSRRS